MNKREQVRGEENTGECVREQMSEKERTGKWGRKNR